jgi:hypothetical protein
MLLNPLSYKLIDRSRDLSKTLDPDPVINTDSKERLSLGGVSIIPLFKDFNDF